MKLAEVKYTRDVGGNWTAGVFTDLCDSGVVRRFIIPGSVQVIWISLHTRQTANRWPVKIKVQDDRRGWFLVEVLRHEGIPGCRAIGSGIDDLLKQVHDKVGNRTIYAEVQYY